MTWLLRYMMRRGWDRGFVGGNRAWAVLGGAAFVAHLARRTMKRSPDLVFRDEIQPGEIWSITHEEWPQV